jgi:hypothetical protein
MPQGLLDRPVKPGDDSGVSIKSKNALPRVLALGMVMAPLAARSRRMKQSFAGES